MAQLVDDGSTSYVQANGAQEAIESGNTTSYPLTDALGSVRGVTDSSGTLTGTTDYDAFGAVRSQTGTSLALGYTGQLTDPSTGFIDLRARQLDPTLGRFLSADTVQPNAPGTQGYNLYAYTANNPTTWVDPSGHNALAGTEFTGPMVAAAAMQIAYRSAALLTAAICSVRSCFAGTALLVLRLASWSVSSISAAPVGRRRCIRPAFLPSTAQQRWPAPGQAVLPQFVTRRRPSQTCPPSANRQLTQHRDHERSGPTSDG